MQSLKNKIISLEVRQQIVADYNSGVKSTVIAKKFGCSTKTVCKILKEFSVEIRSTGSYRKLPLDENYFEIIDTSEKAYWLGFIAADGCVTKHKTKSWFQICLQQGDKLHLDQLKIDLKSGVKIFDVKHLNKGKLGEYANGQPHYYSRLHICSNKLVDDLEKLGVCQRKSNVGVTPWNGPKHLLKYYFRGLIDGDGCIGEYHLKNGQVQWKLSLAGCFDLLTAFVNWVNDELCLRKPKVCNMGNIYQMSYGGREIPYKVIKLLYSEGGIALQRKMTIARHIIEEGDKFFAQ